MTPILALHGFTGCAEDFLPLRDELPGDVRLVAPDLPGHGRRSDLRQPGDYSLEAHLSVISEAAGEHQELTVVGYSMGGRLALHWVLAHPGRVRRLVLIGASPGLETLEEREERKVADEALARHILKQGLDGFYKYWHNQPFFRSLLELPPGRLEPIMERRARNDPEGLALSLSHVGTGMLPSLWARLGEIRHPVDLVTGENDPKFTVLARRMGERLTKVRLSVIADAGHAVHLEQPRDLAMLLR